MCNETEGDDGAQNLDPVTLELLHPEHPRHPFVVSPDGSATICYNESTLRRIAEDRGMWMQPPHFREPMDPDLVRKCEGLGGPLGPARPSRFPLEDADGNLGAFWYSSRFDWLLERFSGPVHEGDVYVCPYCYDYLEGKCPSHDPLNVVLYKGIDKVPLFVFYSIRDWRKHLAERHHVDPKAEELDGGFCKLKTIIYSWMNDDPLGQRYFTVESSTIKSEADPWNAEGRHRVRKEAAKPQISLRQYWGADGRYNAIRYNSIRNAVDVGPMGGETPLVSEGEEDEVQLSDEDDFIDDDLGDTHLYNKRVGRKARGKQCTARRSKQSDGQSSGGESDEGAGEDPDVAGGQQDEQSSASSHSSDESQDSSSDKGSDRDDEGEHKATGGLHRLKSDDDGEAPGAKQASGDAEDTDPDQQPPPVAKKPKHAIVSDSDDSP
eukprot:m51a1_g11064 hypothetical protein (435) ;mRNA; r:535272-537124